jgi:hypothetical protein
MAPRLFSPLSCLRPKGAAMSAATGRYRTDNSTAGRWCTQPRDRATASTWPALNLSQAKEPVAILPCLDVPVAGGSSRPSMGGGTHATSCPGETAEEAVSRSGWKPRALPLSGRYRNDDIALSAATPHSQPRKARNGARRLKRHWPPVLCGWGNALNQLPRASSATARNSPGLRAGGFLDATA